MKKIYNLLLTRKQGRSRVDHAEWQELQNVNYINRQFPVQWNKQTKTISSFEQIKDTGDHESNELKTERIFFQSRARMIFPIPRDEIIQTIKEQESNQKNSTCSAVIKILY